MAAPKGNTYSSKNNRLVADTLRRLAIQNDGKRLRKMCEALFDKAETGDVTAAKEISDRLDGKVAQAIVGDPTQPVHFAIGLPWLSQQIQNRN